MTIYKKEQIPIMIGGIPIRYFSKEQIDLIFSNPKIIDIIEMVAEWKEKEK